MASQTVAQYGGGTGTPQDPYLIFDPNQMNAIAANAKDCSNVELTCGFVASGMVKYFFSDKDISTGFFPGGEAKCFRSLA